MAVDNWEEIRNGIFAGESGGDYNALFGFSNRDGKRYSNVRLTDMTINDALEFASPSGDYGQWVKGQVGRVATPMGAYQVVGTTLRAAKEALGLSGNERMDQATQDRIGQWILANQGTAAWEGYRGPQSQAPTPPTQAQQIGNDTMAALGLPQNNQQNMPQQPFYGGAGANNGYQAAMMQPQVSMQPQQQNALAQMQQPRYQNALNVADFINPIQANALSRGIING
ncbi:hypothetical protein [Loktanella sp. R86503]|uniref:hypothetical protein n=1 Tax=Loktanella sp. R86503 TaxID=3093847 RepID=UPI0036D7E76F